MKLTRRAVLRMGAGASVLPLTTAYPLRSQSAKAADVSAAGATPLARRLADYALGLRYEDLDPVTIERVKIHMIDSLGCGVGALNEPAVRNLPRGRATGRWHVHRHRDQSPDDA